MEPEHSNDIVDKNVAIATPDAGEEEKTNEINGTVQIEHSSPDNVESPTDSNNCTAVDQVTLDTQDIPEEPAVVTDTLPEETSVVSEAKQTPADITADTTANITANTTADNTADNTADTPADTTADTTADTPADTTADTTANTTADNTADTTADTTADNTANITADTTADTPADTTADSVTEDAPVSDSTGPVVEDSNGNKEVDIEQLPTEQQQQDVLQAEDTPLTKVSEESEPTEELPSLPVTALREQTADTTEATETQPTNRPLRSPSLSRSSLSRKESRSRHSKRVSFTGPQETQVKQAAEPIPAAWPESADFTAELGERAVGEHVREKWLLSDSWLHCVDYMGEQPSGSNRHQYRVKFSQPTRRRPVPAHTASVYFTLVPGGTGAVGVWWVMEGQRTLHKPGEGPFREKWLKDILEAKSIICSETLF